MLNADILALAKTGNLAQIKEYLDKNPHEINRTDRFDDQYNEIRSNIQANTPWPLEDVSITALDIAAFYERLEVVKHLVSKGVRINFGLYRYKNLSEPIRNALKQAKYQKNGFPPDVPEDYLSNKYDRESIRIQSFVQSTTRNSKNVNFVIAAIRYDPNYLYMQFSNRTTFLELALFYAHPIIIETILLYGIPLQENALSCVMTRISGVYKLSDDLILQLLNTLKKYGGLNDSEKNTEALITAFREKHIVAIEFLLKQSIDWDYCDKTNTRDTPANTIVHKALLYYPQAVKIILDKNIDTNQKDAEGLTLMHKIARRPKHLSMDQIREIFQALKKHHANPTIREVDTNATPYQFAVLHHQQEIATAIQQYTDELYKNGEYTKPFNTIAAQDLQIVNRMIVGNSFRISTETEPSLTLEALNKYVSCKGVKLKKQIGEGGFGEVHFAMWRHAPVAVKFMTTGFNDEQLQQLADETVIMRQLPSPYLVSFYGLMYDDTQKRIGIVMEYLPHGNLFNKIHSREEMSFAKKVQIFYRVVRGVYGLHSTGYLHRDIKTPNILLDEADKPKLCDLGLAIVASSSTVNDVVGTPGWSAPEIILGEANTKESDIFALGVVLWELVTRKLPPKEDDRQGVAAYIMPDDMDPTIKGLINCCLMRDPKQRPDAKAVRSTIKNIAEKNGITLTKT